MKRGAQSPYLHAANVNGQDSGEEEHLEEEVRHQAHNSEETELLQPADKGAITSGPAPSRPHQGTAETLFPNPRQWAGRQAVGTLLIPRDTSLLLNKLPGPRLNPVWVSLKGSCQQPYETTGGRAGES